MAWTSVRPDKFQSAGAYDMGCRFLRGDNAENGEGSPKGMCQTPVWDPLSAEIQRVPSLPLSHPLHDYLNSALVGPPTSYIPGLVYANMKEAANTIYIPCAYNINMVISINDHYARRCPNYYPTL